MELTDKEIAAYQKMRDNLRDIEIAGDKPVSMILVSFETAVATGLITRVTFVIDKGDSSVSISPLVFRNTRFDRYSFANAVAPEEHPEWISTSYETDIQQLMLKRDCAIIAMLAIT